MVFEKKKTAIFLFIILMVFLTFFNIFFYNIGSFSSDLENIQSANSSNFDILEFWDSEIDRVNAVPLNISYGTTGPLNYTNPYTKKEYAFSTKEIFFDSPNWVGATPSTIRLHGYLLYPEVVQSVNPGCLCMHGLNGNANSSFDRAFPYLEKGFIVLSHSHPGHGNSQGALPSSDSFSFQGDFNRTAHNYLTICGAIQGLRILESLTKVDNSKIMVTGESYGGLNTMWLSSICGDRIAGAVPFISAGDLNASLVDPTKLFFVIWGYAADRIPASFWENQYLRIDPIYYLKSTKLPPIMWQVGTSDDFFHYYSINGTINAVQHDNAYLEIVPNGHHGFPNIENNTKYFIDYIINGGPAPPKIIVKNPIRESGIAGDIFGVGVTVEPGEEVKSVQVIYKYIDIIGTLWETFDLTKSDDGSWNGNINPGIISSRVDYYFIVTLKGNEGEWFSSRIFSAGHINSVFTVPFYILLIAFISLPAIYLIWRKYRKDVLEVKPEIQQEARKKLIIEISLVIGMEALFYIGLILPLAVFHPSEVSFNNLYLFNNFYTWVMFFGMLSRYIAAIFTITWIIYFQITLMRPMFAGFLKLFYAVVVILVAPVLRAILLGASTRFGTVTYGIGVLFVEISVISSFVIGIWKRKYQVKLGLRIPKTKFYNVDWWLRIKPLKIEEKDVDVKEIID